MTVIDLFSVNTVAVNILGYPMSWLELVGTVFNLWCVWLAARKNIWTWPIGLVGIVCYFFLFHQIQLYSDMGEQVYFFVMTFYGWWVWSKSGPADDSGFVKTLTTGGRLAWLAVIAAGTAAMTFVATSLPSWLPAWFPEAASYAWLDAATTVMSFVATYLMAKRFFECWPLWIAVDVIGVWLYFVKGVKFISLEYVIFLVMACLGAYAWYQAARAPASSPKKA